MTVRPVEAGATTEVDQAVRGAQDKLLALARVAQVTGDPAGPMLEALAAQIDAEHRLFEDLKRTLAEVKHPSAVFNDKQVDDIGRRLLGACQAWSAGLVKSSVWRSWAALAAIMLAVGGAGVGAGWWLHAPPSELACTDQSDGSRLCWMYTRLPTQQLKATR
jgi:hypothetical protein